MMYKMRTNIASRIRQVAAYSGLNEVTFAKRIGVPQSTFNKQMNGVNAISLDTVTSIASAFPAVSLDWLICGVGEMIKSETATVPYPNVMRLLEDTLEENKILKQKIKDETI